MFFTLVVATDLTDMYHNNKNIKEYNIGWMCRRNLEVKKMTM